MRRYREGAEHGLGVDGALIPHADGDRRLRAKTARPDVQIAMIRISDWSRTKELQAARVSGPTARKTSSRIPEADNEPVAPARLQGGRTRAPSYLPARDPSACTRAV